MKQKINKEAFQKEKEIFCAWYQGILTSMVINNWIKKIQMTLGVIGHQRSLNQMWCQPLHQKYITSYTQSEIYRGIFDSYGGTSGKIFDNYYGHYVGEV